MARLEGSSKQLYIPPSSRRRRRSPRQREHESEKEGTLGLALMHERPEDTHSRLNMDREDSGSR